VENKALAAVTLAELGKTYLMFESGAKMTAALVNRLDHIPLADIQQLKRLRIRDIKRIARSLPRKGFEGIQKAAAVWLGYRYGIMATYYDVASWFAAGKQLGSRLRGRYTSSTTNAYHPPDFINSGQVSTWNVLDEVIRISRTPQSTAGGLVQAEPSASALESFGLLNALSTAWELIPYSFVIDWFADVGKRLAALEGTVLRPVLGSWVVHRSQLYYEQSKTYTPRDYVSGSIRYVNVGIEGASSLVQDSCSLVQRVANPSFSVLPAINVKLNTKRVLDGISLLTISSEKMRRLLR
jgi:hypothetical protein